MRRGLWLPLLVGSVGTVALSVYLALTAPMPGELARAHAELGGTESVRRCGACHQGGALRTGCLRCHTEIAAQLGQPVPGSEVATLSASRTPDPTRSAAAPWGYHSWLERDGERSCAPCHPDHLGAEFSPISERSYGPEGHAGFSHPHVSFDLHGAHDQLACRECHVARWRDPLPGPGGKLERLSSYLGLDQSCGRCHRDAHAGEFKRACSSCHSQEQFKGADLFDHATRFALTGAHERVACRRCHRSRDTVANDKPVRFDDTAGRHCADCHVTSHTAPNATVYGSRCERCHQTGAFREIHYTVADHARTFPLRGRHATLGCAVCHKEYAGTLAGASPDNCASCHASPHEPGGMLVLANAHDCRSCHTEDGWALPGFGIEAHARINLPLEGGHADLSCRKCHRERPDPLPRDGRCATCHASPHRSEFEGECATCHLFADATWARGASRITVAEHTRTGFPLATPHAEVDCARCHAAGEPFAARFPGRSAGACRVCHADPHEPALAASYPSCRDCHAGAHFRENDFDRHRHTIYPLDGLHAALDCGKCHERPAADRPAPLRGLPRWCAGCHADPHGRQFGSRAFGQAGHRGRGADCARCHESVPGFRIASFDHTAKTSYPLRGAHAGVACNRCHLPWTFAGNEARLYRGTPTACASCHVDPHRGTLTEGRSITCLDCHDDVAWKPSRFDHEKQSRFHLEGAHEKLDCAACHKEQVLSDGSHFVRYRPLGRRCEDCHGRRGKEVKDG